MTYTFNYHTCSPCRGIGKMNIIGRPRCQTCNGTGYQWSYTRPDEQRLFKKEWFNR